MRCDYSVTFSHAADDPRLVKELFRFRKTLFVDICGWDLPVTGDQERDAFDTDLTLYSGLFYRGELVGMFRAVRTDRPYLGASVFPQLAVYRSFPRDPDYWEISRFGVMPMPGSARHAEMNYAAMFRFAACVGAKGLIAIADRTYERFLAIHGIRALRYGPPQIIGDDRYGDPIEIVAGEIPLACQAGPKFERLVSLAEGMVIDDAAQAFRHIRVPA